MMTRSGWSCVYIYNSSCHIHIRLPLRKSLVQAPTSRLSIIIIYYYNIRNKQSREQQEQYSVCLSSVLMCEHREEVYTFFLFMGYRSMTLYRMPVTYHYIYARCVLSTLIHNNNDKAQSLDDYGYLSMQV